MKTIKETLKQSVSKLLSYLSENYYDVKFNITESSLIRGTETEGLYLFAISSDDESWPYILWEDFKDNIEENIKDYVPLYLNKGESNHVETSFITRDKEFIIFIDIIP